MLHEVRVFLQVPEYMGPIDLLLFVTVLYFGFVWELYCCLLLFLLFHVICDQCMQKQRKVRCNLMADLLAVTGYPSFVSEFQAIFSSGY